MAQTNEAMASRLFICAFDNQKQCNETFRTQEQASRYAILAHGGYPFRISESGLFMCPFAEGFSEKGWARCCPCPLDQACEGFRDVKIPEMRQHIRNEHAQGYDHAASAFPCAYAGCEDEYEMLPSKVLPWGGRKLPLFNSLIAQQSALLETKFSDKLGDEDVFHKPSECELDDLEDFEQDLLLCDRFQDLSQQEPAEKIHQRNVAIWRKQTPALESLASTPWLKTANVLSTAKLTEEMKTLNSKDGRRDPKTAKTIILSTYPTMSKRLMSKDEKWFTWKGESGPPSGQKKRRKPRAGDDPAEPPRDARIDSEKAQEGDEVHCRRSGRRQRRLCRQVWTDCAGRELGFIRVPSPAVIAMEVRRVDRGRGAENSKYKGGFALSRRCLGCSLLFRLGQLASHPEIHLAAENTICASEACNHPAVFATDSCRTHLEKLNKVWYQKQQSLTPEALRDLLSTAINREWSSPGRYNTLVRRRFDEIRNGSRPSSDLVVLDDESSIASLQLFEFCIIDRVFGKTLINTTIKHPYGLNHRVPKRSASAATRIKELWSRHAANSIYSDSGVASIDHIGCAPSCFCTEEGRDHSHNGLSRGYYDILPPDEMCVPLISLFRELDSGAAGPPAFPPEIGNIIPSSLSSAPFAFDEFCKPVQERGPDWNPLKFPVTPQNSITEHFDRVNDSGKRKRSAINGDAMASKRTR
ncbi:hypothetical protein ACJZ2D_006994 [Fusarium nematophilum]